jgi:hypothetical protein
VLDGIRRIISGFFLLLAVLVFASEQPNGAPGIITAIGASLFVAFVAIAAIVWPAKVSHIIKQIRDDITIH